MSERWWLCPNDPPCGHGSVLHDVEEFRGDGTETCCVEGCNCGRTTVAAPEATQGEGTP